MAEVIVDRYVIETQEAQKNLQAVNNSLTEISNKSKKTSAQMNTDFTNAARGGAALTKQYNGLNLAVSQFARELPNAAQSAQIFFMSIGNNFGQLQDAISRINAQNKELAAQGQKTVPVFKQIASAIFSLNSAINIGVLVMVLYGKEIGNFISSLFKGSQAIDQAKKSFETLNAALDSKALLKAVSDINLLRTNIDLAKQGFLNKKDVVDQYNSSIGKTTGEVTTLDQAEQQLVKNGAAYIQMTLLKAAANLANEEAAQASVDAMKATLEEEKRVKEDAERQVVGGSGLDAELRGLQQSSTISLQTEIKARRKASADRIAALQEIAKRFQTEAANIAAQNQFNFFGDTQQQQQSIDNLTRITTELTKISKIQPTIPNTQAELTGGLRPSSAGTPLADLSNDQLFTELFNARKNGEKEYTKFLEEELNRRVQLAENANKQEIEDTQSKADEEAEIERRLSQLAIDTVRNLFSLRKELEQSATDDRLQRLEDEKAKELNVEGLTVEQREQIEEDFQAKKSALLNRNAEIQRRIDLTQILVATALATIRELARGGPALAAIAAIEGALAYAFAASQPLPKFAKGTERVTGGEKGRDSVHALLMPDEAVITANENMRHPGLARAWNAGKLEQFLAMKYIEPILNEVYSKDAAKINNQFINNNKVSGINDKRIVKSMQENTAVNRLVLKEIRGKNSGRSDRNLWN